MASAEKWITKLVLWRSAGAPFGVVIATCLSTELVVIGGVYVSELRGWTAESCTGSYPLEAVASSHVGGRYMPEAGTFLVVSVELALDGVPWLGAAPMFVRPGVSVESPSDLSK
jgi:hypothetical protein